jgi:hypothetical protein
MREDYKTPAQRCTLDGVAYESLLPGFFTIRRGRFPDRQKPNEVCIGSSRDGFASMEGDGTLTTRALRFKGSHLFVGLDAPDDEPAVDLLRDGKESRRSEALRGNGTGLAAALDPSEVAGAPVQFRFRLRKAKPYAFRVTPDPGGASFGYGAAGGPGFTGAVDLAR